MKDKDAYVQKLHDQIDAWNADIDQLKAKADRTEAEAREVYLKQVDALRAKVDAFREKSSEIRQAGEGAWQDLRAGVDLAWEAIHEAVRSATRRLNETD